MVPALLHREAINSVSLGYLYDRECTTQPHADKKLSYRASTAMAREMSCYDKYADARNRSPLKSDADEYSPSCQHIVQLIAAC